MISLSSQEKELLRPVFSFSRAKGVSLFLVGGALRDKLLGRRKSNPDFDFAIRSKGIVFAAGLARQLKAGFVILDKEHGACRVVKKIGETSITFDFTDFRGRKIEQDLARRDFTVNSIALELNRAFGRNPHGYLIDPYGGQSDIKLRLIRMVNQDSFADDPLRILRAFSFSCILGFKIEPKTLRCAKANKKNITKVSFERIRDELFRAFSSGNSHEVFLLLDKIKILELIFPEFKKMRGIGQGPYHHLDVWQHTLETLRQLEALFTQIRKRRELGSYLDEIISSDRSRRQVLKLGAFLHDIGKPAALRREKGKIIFHGHERLGLGLMEDICRRLRLSNNEIHCLHKIVLWHLRPGYMADNRELTARAKFRYFRDAAEEAVSILLLSIADQRATKGPLTTLSSRKKHEQLCFRLIAEYYRKKKEKKKQRLINGNDLMYRFGLEPSKLIGRLLKEIEELQAIGRIKSKQEALRAAGRLLRPHAHEKGYN